MPITGPTQPYVRGKYSLELDGVTAGWVSSSDGGYATADVVVETIAVDHVLHKHIAGVKYEDITVNCDTGMSNGLYDWLRAMLNQQAERKNGAIVTADYNEKEVSRINFYNGLITEVGFPALDAASQDAANLTIKIAPEYTRRQVGSGALVGQPSRELGARPKWSSANFRLKIDGLDCTRVSKIDAITLRQRVVEHRVGESRTSQKEPADLEVPNLVVTLAESRAQTFYDWHQDFVIAGNSGQGKEKNGTLEYLAPDLNQVLFSLTLKQLGIFKLYPVNVDASISRVCAEMYCEEMVFSYPGTASRAGTTSTAVKVGDVQPSLPPASIALPTQVARLAPPLRFRA